MTVAGATKKVQTLRNRRRRGAAKKGMMGEGGSTV